MKLHFTAITCFMMIMACLTMTIQSASIRSDAKRSVASNHDQEYFTEELKKLIRMAKEVSGRNKRNFLNGADALGWLVRQQLNMEYDT
ncbi:hypothetical protein SNEBB_011171 [Seison nebaliae]|nr:hypothetical protein SNEBB_011171 [Seison nebaliae]